LGYIDLHTHILPGLDDGPADLDSAVALARDLAARGFRTVVATPHCFEGNPPPATIETQRQLLVKELARLGVPLEVLPGAEHSPDPYLARRLQAIIREIEQAEIPIGILTAVFGAPVFAFLLRKSQRA